MIGSRKFHFVEWMKNEASDLLAKSPLFAGLDREHCDSLASAAERQSLRKGDVLFIEGRPGEGVFLLASGGIQLLKTSEEGKEIVIRTVAQGEIFAEAVLFQVAVYPVTARALHHSAVYLIPRRTFLGMLEGAAFREDFLAAMMRRLRYLTDRILELTTASSQERLFAFLNKRYGVRNRYVLSLSKKDVAAAIGVTPETLSRLILRLAEQGVMTWRGKTLTRHTVGQESSDG